MFVAACAAIVFAFACAPDLQTWAEQRRAKRYQTRLQMRARVAGEPPVSIKKSISANHLISMEDGRQYESLKRHLTAGPYPGAVPGEVVPANGLPDGRAELFQSSIRAGERVGTWADA
jgi:hypothetical protein